MKKTISLLLALIMLFSCIISVSAEDIRYIYVSESGSDENPGSFAKPVASLSKACELAKSGNAVISIMGGTYKIEKAADLGNAKNVTITSDDAIEALSDPKTFNSVNIIGGTLGSDTVIRVNANESASMVATNITGTRGSGNGRVLYATPKMTIDGVTVAEGSTMYNVFEGSQDKQEAHLVNEFEAKNVTVDNPSLSHNVFNIYQVADNATIKVSNSYFNLDVANSNVMRLSNITNAENVNVVFENVDWTYENRDTTNASNNAWAGLVIIQPYGTDMAHNGDTSKHQTWNMTFRNCRYNGELVDANNFGTIKQVAYFYDLNKSGGTSDVVGTLNVTFE